MINWQHFDILEKCYNGFKRLSYDADIEAKEKFSEFLLTCCRSEDTKQTIVYTYTMFIARGVE